MIFIPSVQLPLEATPLAWCFAFADGKFLLPEDDSGTLQPVGLDAFEGHAESRHYLGLLQGLDCWALKLHAAPPGWRMVALRAAMMQFPEVLLGLAGRAAQVLEWDRAHRFCGVCGTPTAAQANERSRKCPACGHVAYPRLSPAMMALVWRGAELLLARSPHYAPGMFSALAGFVEAGESLEDCVHREVAEEVNVRVHNLRYYGSQSWPFPHSLMVAFSAEWVSGEIVPQEDEIEAAGWYRIDALPGIPPRFSIAGHLIRDTVERLRAA
ncbi:MAG: NAD(+) diphosphatase [Rubrivivax sp.]